MATLKNLTINDTGSLTVATGTTAQRDNTNGNFRHNTETGKLETYVNGAWIAADAGVSSHGATTMAVGGTVTVAGGYRIHTFTTVGAGTFNAPYTGRVELLVVAAGVDEIGLDN
jgi:hypothetical protein